ncbi:hypothetical protein D3C72_1408440 [compost metagenome]
MCSRRWLSSTAPLRSKAQRPAWDMLLDSGGWPRRLLRDVRFAAGVIKLRRPVKLSAPARPAPTSSCKAVSSSLGSRWASCVSSSKNSAPCAFSTSWTRCARAPRLSSVGTGARLRHNPRCSRGNSTSGVLDKVLLDTVAASRLQANCPLRQASSSQCGL